ncbi:hypothetical protein AKJ09_10143 [Labilithrix luteola]|uniref:Uncharacterized protein n=1 Tax=Labilithrix luteola TaxID=1391654 RepID=A0A0K1QDG9_9BACT|nr:hypothetical protein AKJ09_10143 [Labilithrix luteola]
MTAAIHVSPNYSRGPPFATILTESIVSVSNCEAGRRHQSVSVAKAARLWVWAVTKPDQ